MPTLNLGILAHVDAGKTTLTERLLYETGATRHLGRVDHGDTTTDSDSIERRRGITIRTAVATMTLPSPHGPVKVNLIDTPGHADFVAEVERALAVLDGAVLVVSAVEGVQAQTRVIIRILERLGLPFLVFVNKMDRAGASLERTLDALREELAGCRRRASTGQVSRRGGARRRGAVGRPAAARVRRRAAARTNSRRSRPWPSRPGSGTSTRCCPARPWPASGSPTSWPRSRRTSRPSRAVRTSRCTRRSSRSTATPTATGWPTCASTRAGSPPATT